MIILTSAYIFLVIILLGSIAVPPTRKKTTTRKKKAQEDPFQDLDEMFQNDVSFSTYYAIKNISTDYKFNYNATEELLRRLLESNRTSPLVTKEGFLRALEDAEEMESNPDHTNVETTSKTPSTKFRYTPAKGRRFLQTVIVTNPAMQKHRNNEFDYHMYFQIYGCMMVTNTYRSAFYDMREYFPLRILYHNNPEYEIGYLVYDITHKYQSVLEVFHLAYIRYGKNNCTNLAPESYMYYLYRVIAQSCKVIINLVNTLHEIKRKYRGHNTVFTIKESRVKKPLTEAQLKAQAQAKKKKQQRQQLADGILKLDMYHGKPPKRSGRFPKVYGWSIEDWWMVPMKGPYSANNDPYAPRPSFNDPSDSAQEKP